MGQARHWRVIGVVTFVVAGFLLLSMGGAIVAAPITVPLMCVAAFRRPTIAFRIAAVVLSGLTVAEVVWAVTYLTVEDSQPWIWLLPTAGAFTAVALVRRMTPA